MMWSSIHDNTKTIVGALALISLGAAGQSIVDKSAKLPWLHQQAAVAQHDQAVVIPKISAVAGCQTFRAKVAAGEAKASEAGADVNLAAIPNCPGLPQVKK